MRHPYKMRRVVGWCTRPNRFDADLIYKLDVLECGHVRHMPQIYGVSDALRAALETLTHDLGKRRCYECAKPDRLSHFKNTPA